MSNTKIPLKANSRRWLGRYQRKLDAWLGMMDASFFARLHQQLDKIRQPETDHYAGRVKNLFQGEDFSASGSDGDRIYIHNDFLKHPAFARLMEKDKAKLWLKYAVACLILANAALLEEDSVSFFWRPILAASEEEQMRIWPAVHLGLRIRDTLAQ